MKEVKEAQLNNETDKRTKTAKGKKRKSAQKMYQKGS